jgi:uncharacterized membrane-anchored protein YhcB (DUF1043 family)
MKRIIIWTTIVVVGLFIGVMIEPQRKPNVVEKDPIMKSLEEGKSSMEIYEEMMKNKLEEYNDTL